MWLYGTKAGQKALDSDRLLKRGFRKRIEKFSNIQSCGDSCDKTEYGQTTGRQWLGYFRVWGKNLENVTLKPET